MVKESDLDIYDVWQAPSGNLFIKVSENYSIAIGPFNNHEPNESDLGRTQYVIKSDHPICIKVGSMKIKPYEKN